MTPICISCGVERNSTTFYSGRMAKCKSCLGKERRERYATDVEYRNKEHARCLSWRSEKTAYDKQRKAEWYKKNRERSLARSKLYQITRPEVFAKHMAKRRALLLNATPPWADEAKIDQFYKIASQKSRETGYEWHVDHIVPLKSKLVCGLHVESNLRVIPGSENVRKYNTWVV